MNDKIRQHLIAYNKANSYETSDKDLLETVTEANVIYEEITGSHRWYEDEFRVVEIDGMLLGYDGFHMTGDNGMSEMDLEYDINTVVEVKPVQKTITVYEPI